LPLSQAKQFCLFCNKEAISLINKKNGYFLRWKTELDQLNDSSWSNIIKQNSCGYVYINCHELFNMVKELVENKSLRDKMGVASKCLFNEQYRADIVYNRFSKHIEFVQEQVSR
jgi:hypothetical protein